jgi:ABC-type transport system substrate-binding protein
LSRSFDEIVIVRANVHFKTDRKSKFAHMRHLLLFIGVLLAVGCTRSHQFTDKFIFHYNEPNGINSLDPAFARDKSSIWATHQLFNGLVQMDTLLSIQPAIAHRYLVDSTGTHYTFYLKPDVYFHKNACFGPDSTRAVIANDFVYSFNRLRDPDLASPGKWTLDAVADIWAESDVELHIKLKYPFAPFLGVLTMKYCSVVPQEAIETYGRDFSNRPVGTGPFQFRAWHRNEKLVLNRNPNYFETDRKGRQLPYADGVAITFITDQQAAFLEFLKGNIDLISGLDASYKDEILTQTGELRERYATDFVLKKQPYLNTEYLIFSVDTAQTSTQLDKRIRTAINLGFNRIDMMAYLRNNIGRPADGGMIPYSLPGNISGKGFVYNPEKARQLLNEVLTEMGALPEITLTTVSNYRDLCEFIQSELGKLGLTINVDVIPAANLREQKSQGNLSFFRASWIADYPDAENYLSLFYSPNRSPAGPNYSRFYNLTFDKWYTRARTTANDSLRLSLYQQMDSLILDEAPIVPLYYDEVVRIYPKTIQGLQGNGLNLLDLRQVKKLD